MRRFRILSTHCGLRWEIRVVKAVDLLILGISSYPHSLKLESGRSLPLPWQRANLSSFTRSSFPAEMEPVIVYIRDQICGENRLKSTSLKSLGLISGRSLLRVNQRQKPDDGSSSASTSSSATAASTDATAAAAVMDVDAPTSPPPTLRSASHLPPWRKRNLGRPKRVLKEVIVLEDGEHVVMADFWSFARWVLLILAESGQISLYSEELHPLAILFLYSGIIVFIPLYWKGKKRKQKIFVSVAKLT